MIQINNVTFNYAGGDESARLMRDGLHDVSLHIRRGELVLLCGESGCGKTTLTRLINGLIPHYYEGNLAGEVLVNGSDVTKTELYELSKTVGSVFQNPRSQFFNVETDSELAFACENQGLPFDEIEARLDDTIAHLKIESLMGRNIFKLSGGEKQKIACGCVHTAVPEIIVLDEPSSNLDARATADLAKIIEHWRSEGRTIVIAEHRLHYLRAFADRIIFMKNGAIEREFTIAEAQAQTPALWAELGLRPLLFDDLESSVNSTAAVEKIKLCDFDFAYKDGCDALRAGSFEIPRGGIIAMIGHNGAGKSTLARCLCGLNKRFRGTVRIGERTLTRRTLLRSAYMVMQDVNHQLFCENVRAEVLLSSPTEDEVRVDELLASLNLSELAELHPMSLSGGQKQRVAVAGALAAERELIIFDEPTSGLDLRHMQQVSALIRDLRDGGKTVFVISHDLELILQACDHVIQLKDGKIRANYPLAGNAEQLIAAFTQ